MVARDYVSVHACNHITTLALRHNSHGIVVVSSRVVLGWGHFR